MDVTWGGALIAGVLSFVSPCVLPLVPPYLCYLAGVSFDQLSGQSSVTVARRTIFLSAFAFVLGFSTVFVALGATASAFGQFARELFAWHFELPFSIGGSPVRVPVLASLAGLVIIVMGLHFLGVFRIGLLHRQARMEVRNHPAGQLGSYVVGLAFAIGWTPCIGPVLATILAVAASEETVGQGASLLAVYSLGLGIPFLIAGAFAGAFLNAMKRMRRHMDKVEKAMGALLVVTGLLFVTGQFTVIGFWLLDTFPGLATLG